MGAAGSVPTEGASAEKEVEVYNAMKAEFAAQEGKEGPEAVAALKAKWEELTGMTCTPELFDKLKDVKTATGYTFSNAIQTGTETPHLGVGITAGDEECYEKFAEIINPVIAGWR